MSKKEKLIQRIKSKPRDFTFDELESLLLSFGFEKCKTGKSGGSRVKYICGKIIIRIYKPHPGNILKPYQIAHVLDDIRKAGLI